MKWKFTLFFLFIAFLQLTAQDITGVWRGTFDQQNYDPMFGKFFSETYKYEVQLNNLKSNALEGVTYSYQSTKFYGKATLNGVYKPKSKGLIIKELKLVEMKSEGPSDGCLMTCYLDYKKEGNIETLTGNYTSINIRTNKDCGTGTVTLTRVPESKFKKEDFLLKKENKLIPKNSSVTKTIPKPNSSNIVRTLPKNNPNFNDNPPPKTAPKLVAPKTAAPKDVAKPKSLNPTKKTETVKTFPKQKETKPTIGKIAEQPANPADKSITIKEAPTQNSVTTAKPKTIELDKPKILEERKNKLNSNLVVDAQDVVLEFYDNGEIDGDVITVYKNNELVLNKKLLSTQPLTLKLHFTEHGEQINIYTVAETLGEIAPNTALMVVTFGGKRQEILLTSDSKTNALTVIEYNKANRKY